MIMSAASLYSTLAVWIAVAIIGVVAATYVLRPRVRDRYPGGRMRYALALTVQAAAFMIPIPIVIILLLGVPIPTGVDVVLAITAGVAVVVALRYAPVTGRLLGDLHQARLQDLNDRPGPRS
jgi:hypothetical protein